MSRVGKCFASVVLLLLSGNVLEAETNAQAQQTEPSAEEIDQSTTRDPVLRNAETLINKGDAAAAYALLEPLEFDRAGEVQFDYLLALAALDSGQPAKATLVLERVLAVDPGFAGARLDLARAYYQLGDTSRAKGEFATVLQEDPPPAARAAIESYLDAIAAQESARKTTFSGYLEGSLGHDTNVNASTSQTQISIPGQGNVLVDLSPLNVKAADNYYGIAAGGNVTHNLDGKWGVYAAGDLSQRGYLAQTGFDTASVTARAGVVFAGEKNRVRAGVSAGTYTLGSARNRNTVGFEAAWSRAVGQNDMLTVFGQSNRYRFVAEPMKTNDFDQHIAGAGWLHVTADGKAAVFGSLYYGRESDVAPATAANPAGGRIDGAKRLQGMRVGGEVAVTDRTKLFINAGWQEGTYRRTNPLFLRQRSDRLYDVAVGANVQRDKQWTIRPQLTYVRNESNIAIYSFDRTDMSVTVRRDFR